jgi:NTE family protein
MPGFRTIAAVLLAGMAFKAFAIEPSPQPRLKVALVLSGGGARGLAHIGVLKVLREAQVPVDLIVATSMGSIVGGAYAAGHTPDEMEKLINSADWEQIFSDRAPREYLTFRRKADDVRFIGKTELGFKDGGVVLPRGALGSQNLEEFLREVARPASDARTLNDLPILFRAVATDLVTGKQVVLEDVPLPVAMRASMSIPGAFAPTQVDGRLLGDGGLVRNLPVEIAREMGADIIIAVNVGTPLLPRETLSSALGVAQQMVNILTEQNVEISLKALRSSDILISPDLAGVSFIDFEQGPEIIKRGEAAARGMLERLEALSWKPEQYAAWESIRTRKPASVDLAIAKVVVKGTERTNPEAVLRTVERAGVRAGSTCDDEHLIAAARMLHGTGDYERVDVRAELQEGHRIVVIDLDEKSWGPNYLRLGGRASSDFQTDARFSLTLQHTMTWVNSWGAEWRNEITLGDTRRLTTGFFQPLGPGSPYFVETFADGAKFSADHFDAGYHRTDRVTVEQQTYAGMVGTRLGSIGVARLGLGYQRYKVRPLIGVPVGEVQNDSARVTIADLTLDTLDDPNFPRKGYLVEATGQSIDYKSDSNKDAVQTYVMGGLFPVTFGRLTLLGIVNAARSRDDRGGFSLGGFLNLSGTPAGALSGSQAAIVEGVAYYRLNVDFLPKAIGKSLYAGFSLEAGNAWQSKSDIRYGDVKKAAAVFVGLDSILGPLYLGYGRTFGGQSALYLYLGRPIDRIVGGGP